MPARDLREVFNDFAAKYSGDLERDLAERALSSDPAMDVAVRMVAWLSTGDPDQQRAMAQTLVQPGATIHMDAPVALAMVQVAMMVGVDWNREARRDG